MGLERSRERVETSQASESEGRSLGLLQLLLGATIALTAVNRRRRMPVSGDWPRDDRIAFGENGSAGRTADRPTDIPPRGW